MRDTFITNIVLKLNLKDDGYSLVWLYPDDSLKNTDVEIYFPKIEDNIFGPNLGFTSERISHETIYIATTSRWNLKDEFGRKGLSLSQGIVINTNPTDPQLMSRVCSASSILLKIHKTRYKTLGELIGILAASGNESEARRIAIETFNSINQGSDDYDPLFMDFVNHLKDELDHEKTRLRVYTDFPWSEEVGFLSLIGLQVASRDINSVGGGYLGSFNRFQHISTSQEVPGFKFADLSRVVSPRPNEKGFRPTQQSNELVMPDNTWYRVVVIGTLFSIIVTFCFGLYLVLINRRILKSLEGRTIVAKPEDADDPLKKQTQALPADNQQGRISTNPAPVQDDQALLQTIAKMYSMDRQERLSAMRELIQNHKSDERVVPIALDYAEENKANTDGIENTFLIIQNYSRGILKKYKAQSINFLELVKSSIPKRRNDAERLRISLIGP
jgi:hypothetical protein